MEKPQFSAMSPEEAEKIAEGIQRHRRNQDYLGTNHETLMEVHKGEWVAVIDEVVIATNPSFLKLFETLDEQNINRQTSSIAIRFLDPNPPTLIL